MTKPSGFLFSFSIFVNQLKWVDVYIPETCESRVRVESSPSLFDTSPDSDSGSDLFLNSSLDSGSDSINFQKSSPNLNEL